ncbi:hypothetical protein ACFXPI_04535 [Streptomyces sp. NPDC059104]|uniref:hypothetical protein n=1 Tax=Streptomyces sp. NPDC059104 TaxID=3346729 RepID=UPI00369E93D7
MRGAAYVRPRTRRDCPPPKRSPGPWTTPPSTPTATALRLHAEAGATRAHGHIDADNTVLADWYRRLGFTVLPPKGELELRMGPYSSAALVPEPGEQLITKRLG